MIGREKVELLAPAGSPDAFYGAVRAGADAVYLAGDRFGARAYAENFTSESLVKCIRYAHLFERRVYLTVNTLFKEHELTELYDYLSPFYEAGLDAVIVQDMGVLRYIRERFPDLGLHASTQMTICGGYGASLLKKLGVCRIVPARELSLKELEEIRRHTDIEIEAFVHGAMCYSYSGQCLFSSILGGRSGNRGRCAQPCRLPYSVAGEENIRGECYPLSLKDMCTVEHIPALIRAGIDSFKIEGRMKKPEYAAGVTAVYRKYIDRYYELRQELPSDEAASAAYRVEEEDLRKLSCLYNRGGAGEIRHCEDRLQTGYYFRKNGREMVTLDNPAYSGSDEALLAEIAGKYLDGRMKLPVAVFAEFQTGKPAMVSLRWRDTFVSVSGAEVVPARNQPITEENVIQQLGKLGESGFVAEDIRISVSEDAFYPLKQINELRRQAVSELEQMIIEENFPGLRGRKAVPEAAGEEAEERRNEAGEVPFRRSDESGVPRSEGRGWSISLQSMAQMQELWGLLERNPDRYAGVFRRIYIDGDLLTQNQESALALCRRMRWQGELWITLPYILRHEDGEYMERLFALASECGGGPSLFAGFLIRSVDELGWLEEKAAWGTASLGKLKRRADVGLYTWNSESLRELTALGVEGFCLPYELKAAEQRELLHCGAGAWDFEKIVYGRIPMMVTANCVLRTTDRCRRDADGRIDLIDRYRKRFPVRLNCLHCMNVIYNSVPLSLHGGIPRQGGAAGGKYTKRLDFTLESGAEMRAVLDAFLGGQAFPLREYTTGHEKRGVE